MGQRQSSSSGEDEIAEAPVKTDFYVLLGVDRQASEDEIKKAYRRKALELHPDRNFGNVDNATKLFAEIQSAYEVLSDPQERAWYDSHRDVLLRGEQPGGAQTGEEFSYNTRMTSTEEVLKLMMRFNVRVEYTDSPSGFYGGLREFFGQLAKEEEIACKWEDLEALEYPEFGHKEDDYEDIVRPFYAAWNGFATKKSYSWKDQHRLSDAPDRRIRRLMEKENRKIRDDAIKEYNEAVRSLIAFVRKRDPRFQGNQKSEAEKQKILRDAAAANAARSRAGRQAKMEELNQTPIPEWARSRTADDHEGGFSSQSEAEEHEFDCVVCNKTFKSEAQFETHEKSKKHIKLLKQLKRDLNREDAGLERELEPEADARKSAEVDAAQSENEKHDQATRNAPSTVEESDPATTAAPDEAKAVEDDPVAGGNHAPSSRSRSDTSSTSASGEDYAPRSEVADRLAGGGLASHLAAATLLHEDTPSTTDTDNTQPKMGKAKLKRAKRAAARKETSADSAAAADFKCTVCKAEFASKNKLFTHLKSHHAAAAPPPVAQVQAGKATKGKKR